MPDEGTIVLSAMGITGLTVLLGEGGLNNYRNFVQAHASGHGYEAAVPNFTGGTVVKWALGLGITTGVLLAVAESDEWAKLAAAFAGVIAVTVLFKMGPAAQKNLYNLFGQGPPAGNVEMSNV